MILTLKAKDFKAVSHLEISDLMANHPKGLRFSQKKPNVIVGPNGAGKSALLTTLSMLTMSNLTGESTFDHRLLGDYNFKDTWKIDSWPRKTHYLPGLDAKTDHAPALYFRPSHVPGNEVSVTHAMMTGYFDAAKEYDRITKNKSSGQQSQALQERVMGVLEGTQPHLKHKFGNWGHKREVQDLEGNYRATDENRQANELLRLFGNAQPGDKPVLLMDEPEQSLDARAELNLWKKIEAADCEKIQIIVATHSLYPLMHASAFNIIEAVPGYVKEVMGMLNPKGTPKTPRRAAKKKT